ncbi:MAG TPA: MFS transporter [Mycobacteriales bacterium]|nr:MFS transporter [Mycobacteriales bacterium]
MRGGDARQPGDLTEERRLRSDPRPSMSADRPDEIRPDLPVPPVPDPAPERPASYREVLAVREFRYLFGAYAMSMLGDQLAKVALSLLVFNRTGSALLTAATLAISYLPWIVGGPMLSAISDRMERRRVLITCDLARAVLVGLIAVPGMPIPVLLLILFLAATFSPPFESARSALTPQMLPGDRYVVGNSMLALTGQVCTMIGFLAGGLLVALITPRGVLLIDAATFVVSALLIVLGVIARPATPAPTPSESAWRQITAGLRYVFHDSRLRTMLLIVWTAAAFGFCWEGVAAPIVDELHGPDWQVGLLLGCSAAGIVVGAVGAVRLCPPALRARLMLPGAVLQQLLLVAVLIDRNIVLVAIAVGLSGVASAFLLPLNAQFMRSVPDHLRGRAFGVAQGGLQAAQGIGLLAAGGVASALAPTTTAAVFGVLGAVGLIPLILSRRFVPA